MPIFRLFILLFITSFCVVHSENLPTYRMVDLGLFETDSSYAYSINEKGQILGTFQENNRSYFFIWDEINGIKFIEPPEHHIFSSMMLNNEGQIAGKMLLPSSNNQTIFYWDINLGFWEIESGITNCFIYGFNDKGQILGVLNGQIILWDHGKKINLSSLFYSQIPGEWSSLHSPRLNNFGHVALLAYDQKLEQNRLFIWNPLGFIIQIQISVLEKSPLPVRIVGINKY